MQNIKLIFGLGLVLSAGSATAKELTLFGKIKSCKTSALLQCEVSVKKSEFQAKSAELADMQLMILTAEKTLHVPINKYSLQPGKQDIQFQLAGLVPKKKDQEQVRNILKKDQYVVLVFKDKGSQDPVVQNHKKKEASPVASVSGGTSSPLIKKKTMRTPAKKGNLLHESVNQLSPGRESRAPDVEYGGPSTYADIDYTH